MLDIAIEQLSNDAHQIVHSDRRAHYRWPDWIERMENVNLTGLMSKKGYSLDYSACKGFFGRLENEMFYNRTWNNDSLEEFLEILDSYMRSYAKVRIKLSLGELSPLEYSEVLD